MKRNPIGALSLWQFDQLSHEKNITHFVTDRASLPGERYFSLSYSSHPERNFIDGNRALLASAIDAEQLIFPSQVHGIRIQIIGRDTVKSDVMETDALITAEKNICIAVMSADCVPVLLYDRLNNVVAAVHSGWRGTVARILEKTLLVMHENFGTEARNILAAIGPSVCQEVYEVGEEVINAVEKSFSAASNLLSARVGGKARLDLWKANKLQLSEYGVLEENIELSNLCTVMQNEYFFSARKGDKGRFAAGIMLRA